MRTLRGTRGRRAFLKTTANLSTLAFGAVNASAETAGTQEAQAVGNPSGPARALLEVVRGRYGTDLDGAADDDLLPRIEANVRADQQLANYRLTNADAPDFVFRTD